MVGDPARVEDDSDEGVTAVDGIFTEHGEALEERESSAISIADEIPSKNRIST